MVKGQPLPLNDSNNSSASQKSTEVLSLLAASSSAFQSHQKSATLNSNLQNNPLVKILNSQMAPTESSFQTSTASFGYGADDLSTHLGVHSSHVGQQQQPQLQNMLKLSQQGQLPLASSPAADPIQKRHREILAAILKQQQQQQQHVGQQRQQQISQSPVQSVMLHHHQQRPTSPTNISQPLSVVGGSGSPRVQSPHQGDAFHSFLHHQRACIPSPLGKLFFFLPKL